MVLCFSQGHCDGHPLVAKPLTEPSLSPSLCGARASCVAAIAHVLPRGSDRGARVHMKDQNCGQHKNGDTCLILEPKWLRRVLVLLVLLVLSHVDENEVFMYTHSVATNATVHCVQI